MATPVGWVGWTSTPLQSIPSASRSLTRCAPFASLPTQPIMATRAPIRAAATAWFPPLPPATCENSCPLMVSPGRGKCGARATRSVLMLPTTRTRPGFTSFDTFNLRLAIRRMVNSHGATPASIRIQHHGDHNDRPRDDPLGGLVCPDLGKARSQHGNDQDTKKGADDRT